MDLIHIIGILIIVVFTLRGYKKGFVKMAGEVCAAILTFLLLSFLKTWMVEELFSDLIGGGSVTVTRLVLCVGVYFLLFLILKLVFLSLGFFSRLPVIRGVNKLLGIVAGGACGVILVGVLYQFYDWIF